MLETPHSFINAMEGAALRRKRELDVGIYTAWHTAVFALGMYGGKLKGAKLSDFLSGEDQQKSSNHALQNAKGIAFFQSLKARGFPVKITRVN